MGSVADGVEWALLEMLRTPEDGEVGHSGAVAASARYPVSTVVMNISLGEWDSSAALVRSTHRERVAGYIAASHEFKPPRFQSSCCAPDQTSNAELGFLCLHED